MFLSIRIGCSHVKLITSFWSKPLQSRLFLGQHGPAFISLDVFQAWRFSLGKVVLFSLKLHQASCISVPCGTLLAFQFSLNLRGYIFGIPGVIGSSIHVHFARLKAWEGSMPGKAQCLGRLKYKSKSLLLLIVVAAIRPTESPWRVHTVGRVWGWNRCLGANVLPVAINAGGIWEHGTWAKAPARANLVTKPGALLLWVPAAMLPGFRPRGSKNGRPTRKGKKDKKGKTLHPNRLNIHPVRLNLTYVVSRK